MDQFQDFTTNLASAPGKIVIMGDFNLHVDVNSALGVFRFMDLLNARDLHQCVGCSTHNAGVLWISSSHGHPTVLSTKCSSPEAKYLIPNQ